jgi:hypothetical protein
MSGGTGIKKDDELPVPALVLRPTKVAQRKRMREGIQVLNERHPERVFFETYSLLAASVVA